jgi:hypothetical protein
MASFSSQDPAVSSPLVIGQRSIAAQIIRLIMHRVPALHLALAICPLAVVGCDPVVNVAGANFPAWLLCAIVGAGLSAIFRPVFAATGIEPYLGPRLLIYPCLAILLACLIYLIFFNRI